MKVVISPQAFKGTVSGASVACAIERGVRRVISDADIILQPVADGGDGTLDVLFQCENVGIEHAEVQDSLGRKHTAPWGYIPNIDTAYIELASICGLSQLEPHQRSPEQTSTFGVGEAVCAVMDRGIKNIVIGLGGSASNDGGAGLLQALGVKFYDEAGCEIGLGGLQLLKLKSIDVSGLDTRVHETHFTAACDVVNPLLGPDGATYVYATQKGATAAILPKLEEALANYAECIESEFAIDVRSMRFCGAAGGTAAGLFAFLNAALIPGIDLILDILNFDQLIDGADLVITGEGMMDRQTVHMKAPYGVAKRAKRQKIPVIAIVGKCGEGYGEMHHHGIDAIFPAPLEQECSSYEEAITNAAEEAFRCFITRSDGGFRAR